MIFRALNWIEESVLALLLAGMTLVTFSQVVARYVFNSGAVWALELTTFLFAWLVLIGASFGIRVSAHIGVDLLVRKLPPLGMKIAALLSACACMTYAVIIFIGGWDTVSLLYLIEIEAEDLPIQRWIPTLAIPVGAALLGLRLLQCTWEIFSGQRQTLLVDEAQDAVDQVRDQ